MQEENFTKYEKARILGARALQIAMNAPLLIKIDKEELEKINFDALKIAELELKSGVLPISIKKPMPERKEDQLKRIKIKKIEDEKKEQIENLEEKEIAEEAEIMELANPEEEKEETSGESEEQ